MEANNSLPQEAQVLKALLGLAQAQRLRCFRALVVAGSTGLTPGQLAQQLDVAASTLSFHLKELLNAGLISCQRDGRSLIYRADFAAMLGILAYLTEHCCQSSPCPTQASPC